MKAVFLQETNEIQLTLTVEEWLRLPYWTAPWLGCTEVEDTMIMQVLKSLENPEGVPTL